MSARRSLDTDRVDPAHARGLALAGWGTAVLLVAHGTVPPARTPPAYMLGIGVGLVVAAALAPKPQRGEWLTSGAIAAALGPLGLYLSYDVARPRPLARVGAEPACLVGRGLFWAVGPRSARRATAAH